jgi:uroporphyrin-III C-methyltransferase/precorrin-2 dehydrogenase/sirohydrochlorin ferrochelatase
MATSSSGGARVHLVGAGPGDPELLTLRAARLLASADVVVYDHLVSDQVLDLVRADAQRIYAGKRRDNHSMPQAEINRLLVKLAKEGKRVVRLKGGDPFVFGRGGEEMRELARHGVAFDVVPGVTAANGVSCYAGIPLTHRDFAQTCIFTTGHLKDGSADLDWDSLVRPRQTVVIYMGLNALPGICAQLRAHGMRTGMPVAVVERATTPQQRVVSATLADIAERVAEAKLESPSLIIVGEVVRLRESLDWFAPASKVSA